MVLSRYGDIMTVGEYGNTSDTNIALRYSSEKERRAGLGFQFENVCIGYAMAEFDLQPFTLCDFKRPWAKWQQFIEGTDGWTSAFLENHDVPRSLGRFGSDEPQYHDATAKMLAMCLATSTGTLFIYQGQEIGMTNIPKSWPIEEYKDLNTQNHWEELLASNPWVDKLQSAINCIQKIARDHGRTPFQWDDSPHAGFTTGKPWMRVNDNYTTVNMMCQAMKDASILSFWKELIALRKKHIDLFAHGSFKYVDEGNQSVMAYIKRFDDQACFVILNYTSSPQPRTLHEEFSGAMVAMTNSSAPDATFLGPYEGAVYMK